ncbi:hypothetical protein [Nonomuraea turcica]|uniref:hypothetical protein n=1 Tax=Nonomuraea sp. G32 TaxID=3067274 RepID=UPI00273BE2FE|nr:hypothetical protein [Nonomuraea sp. G32]MDP4511949.1 hypothetical protein [Nonomuraea sp. G32]
MNIRLLDYGYVIAVKSDHRVRTPAGTSTVSDLISMIPYVLLAVIASLEHRDSAECACVELVAVSSPELLKLLRILVLAPPRQDIDPDHALRWSHWRRRHQHRAAACHRRWNEVTAVSVT